MQLTYKGPHDVVEVPDFGLLAERDETIDVPEAAVADLCALTDNSDVGNPIGWIPADDDARRVLATAIDAAAPDPDRDSDGIAGEDDQGHEDGDATTSEAPEGYPADGTIEEVVSWVHGGELEDIADRARVASEVEEAKNKPRKGLLEHLAELVGDEGDQA